MSDLPNDEAAWRLLNLRVDTMLKAKQYRWQPWTVIIAGIAAAAGMLVAGAALMTLLLHLAGRI